MKRIFTFLFSFVCVLALNAQNPDPTTWNGEMVANFDDMPAADIGSWGGLTIDYAQAPDGTPASGQMVTVGVPAGNPQGASFTISLNSTFNPSYYVGVSFDAQMSADDVSFVVKLQQTSDPGHNNALEDWNTWPSFSCNGGWIEVQIPFDVVNQSLADKLANDPGFPADQYDQIELLPAGWDESKPDFTINLDNMMLRYDWDEGEGIPVIKVAAFILKTVDGTVSVVGGIGAPVSLKVYTTSGQEVASGVNEVNVETKGVFVVKATNGKASSVSKIVVQ